MSHGRQVPLTLLAVVLTMASGTGCAAARAGLQVQDAMTAKQAAADAGAEDAAPYEFTMASRYLEKAWEEMGTGQYKMSVQLSKKSAEWSDQAVVQIARSARELDLDLRDIQDAPPLEAPPEPSAPEPGGPAPEPPPTPETPAPEPETPTAPAPETAPETVPKPTPAPETVETPPPAPDAPIPRVTVEPTPAPPPADDADEVP